MKSSRLRLCCISLVALLGGCQNTSNLYHWGFYEGLIYSNYAEPGRHATETQIEYLERDIAKAAAKDLKNPPGLYAHLGYLYHLAGQEDKAIQAFEAEIQYFPESKHFMTDIQSKLIQKSSDSTTTDEASTP